MSWSARRENPCNGRCRGSLAALIRIPQLARYRRGRERGRRPDLRLLYYWMHQAGLRLTHRESVSVPADMTGKATRILVQRVVTDQYGNVLEITDIDLSAWSASWTREFTT
ncbi:MULTISPECIES: hypothetical protein [unclassified Streptomyces]|uniref:hypothetical protein n=1 Tax=unclassified Streptomyces TaxID=2593676 RepID=UPI00344F286D